MQRERKREESDSAVKMEQDKDTERENRKVQINETAVRMMSHWTACSKSSSYWFILGIVNAGSLRSVDTNNKQTHSHAKTIMNVTAVKHAIFVKHLSLFYNHDFSPSHYNEMTTNNTAALNGRGLQKPNKHAAIKLLQFNTTVLQ